MKRISSTRDAECEETPIAMMDTSNPEGLRRWREILAWVATTLTTGTDTNSTNIVEYIQHHIGGVGGISKRYRPRTMPEKFEADLIRQILLSNRLEDLRIILQGSTLEEALNISPSQIIEADQWLIRQSLQKADIENKRLSNSDDTSPYAVICCPSLQVLIYAWKRSTLEMDLETKDFADKKRSDKMKSKISGKKGGEKSCNQNLEDVIEIVRIFKAENGNNLKLNSALTILTNEGAKTGIASDGSTIRGKRLEYADAKGATKRLRQALKPHGYTPAQYWNKGCPPLKKDGATAPL